MLACSVSVIVLNKEALPCVLRLHKVTTRVLLRVYRDIIFIIGRVLVFYICNYYLRLLVLLELLLDRVMFKLLLLIFIIFGAQTLVRALVLVLHYKAIFGFIVLIFILRSWFYFL